MQLQQRPRHPMRRPSECGVRARSPKYQCVAGCRIVIREPARPATVSAAQPRSHGRRAPSVAASLKPSVQSRALEILSRAGRRARWSRTCGASAQVPDSPSSSLRNAAVENRCPGRVRPAAAISAQCRWQPECPGGEGSSDSDSRAQQTDHGPAGVRSNLKSRSSCQNCQIKFSR